MDSRIILSQADFSANNIGRYVELSEFTRKVLAKQTQYEEGSAESVAINTFLNELVEGGFIGGSSPMLKVLIIPALGSQHNEFFYNLAQVDGEGFPVNWMPSAESSAETKLYVPITDTNSRIIGIEAKTDNGRITSEAAAEQSLFSAGFGYDSDHVLPNISLAFYNLTQAQASTLGDPFIKVFSGSARLTDILMGVVVSNVNYGYVPSGTMLGFLGMTCNNTEHTFNGTADNADLTPTGTTLSSTLYTGDAYDALNIGTFVYSSSRHTRLAMFACGENIFSTQMQTLQSLVDNLMTALHVKSYIQ